MKKIILTLTMLPAIVLAQEQYTVKVDLKEVNPEAKLFLQYEDGNEMSADSASLESSLFELQGEVKEPTLGFLILSEEGESLEELMAAGVRPDMNQVYLSEGTVLVSGEDLATAEITGNSVNEDFQELKKSMSAFEKDFAEVNTEFENATEEEKEDPGFLNSLQEKAEEVYVSQQKFLEDFVNDNTDSFISLSILDEIIDEENAQSYGLEAFNKLSPQLKQSGKGQALQTKINSYKNISVGALAPDFTLPDTTGNDIALSDLKGQYVLVDFWASWCAPCRHENPNVVAAFNDYKDKNFTVFGVSLDNPGQEKNWKDAIEKDKLQEWPHVSDLQGWSSEVVDLYSIRGIPLNFLLDPEGKIIASNLRGKALHDKLAEVLD